MKTDHKNPIVLIAVKGTRLITAAADSVLKVWHLGFRHNSGVLRGCTTLPLCLEYAEFENVGGIAICGTVSGSIHAWNADTNELIASSAKHFTQVSAIKALPKERCFVSAGRDKTLIFWSWNLQPTKVIPVFEEFESIQLVPDNLVERLLRQQLESTVILACGEKGKIRFWDCGKMGEILPSSVEGNKKDFAITSKGVLLKDQKIIDVLPGSEDLVVLQDDLFNICSFQGKKNKIETTCTSSNQHESLDMIIVKDQYLVVANMSPVIKVYDIKTNELFIGSGGHTDSVLAVAKVDENGFVSCGKDHSICLWKIEENSVKLIAKGSGHSSYVGALAASSKFLCSASKDGILKVKYIFILKLLFGKICLYLCLIFYFRFGKNPNQRKKTSLSFKL